LPEASANSGMASPLLVLTAPESVEQSELLVDAVPEIVCQVANRHDLVIINTSAFWTATQAQLARNCSRLLFLMDQRATSIKACQRVLELCIKLQIPEARFAYALNGCHRFAPISPQDASLALGGQEIYRLEDGGTLVDEMLSLGCPWELLDSGNAFVASLDKLLGCLLPLGFNNAMPASSSIQQAKPGFGLDKLKQLFSKGARDVA
ncbi:MAG: hypothetical protein FWH50_01000, partial [Coriobacteriia bacterium]|nr:hypothetical protein [Coriobacteriia bacterium]